MGSRFPSHQLSNGLYVSGHPEQPKERKPTMTSTAVPYTGGDIRKFGDFGKMFDIPVTTTNGAPLSRPGSFTRVSSHSGPIANSGVRSGHTSFTRSYSGPLNKHGQPIRKTSGTQSGMATPTGGRSSGAQSPILPVTGLIVSGPLNSSGLQRKVVSGSLDSSGSIRPNYGSSSTISNNPAVTTIRQQNGRHSFKRNLPISIICVALVLFSIGFVAGVFILVAVHKAAVLVAVAALFCIFASSFIWNYYWGKRAVIRYVAEHPDSELRTAQNGEYVKITGVVTCGNVPLKSSFQKVPRCVYTSTSLYEYREWYTEPANPTHRRFTWGLRASEEHAVDFYISDYQSGVRGLVKFGHGAQVIPFVNESVVIEVDPRKEKPCEEVVQWLEERKLQCENRKMRLKEGYIKEGSTISVMGVVKRNDNMVMIVGTTDEGVTMECQWSKCVFPATMEGIVVKSSEENVIPV